MLGWLLLVVSSKIAHNWKTPTLQSLCDRSLARSLFTAGQCSDQRDTRRVHSVYQVQTVESTTSSKAATSCLCLLAWYHSRSRSLPVAVPVEVLPVLYPYQIPGSIHRYSKSIMAISFNSCDRTRRTARWLVPGTAYHSICIIQTRPGSALR